MALPTAATPGYGFYPTYGSNPDVACNCLRAWLPVFQRLLELKGLGRIVVWNCTSALEASGGTHAGGGAVDWGGISVARAKLAREMGAPATWPRDWVNNRHTHAVLSGCPHKTDAANYQVSACIIYRRDGLGWHGLAGPDPLPLPSKIRTWEQGIAWAQAEIKRLTQEDIVASIDDLRKVIREEVGNVVWNDELPSHDANPDDGVTPPPALARSNLVMANFRASDIQTKVANLQKSVDALGDRESLINDVRDAILNASVPNHDPNPDNGVPPPSFAFRSYPVMANWRAADLQGQVSDVKADVADIKATLEALTKAVAALPKG